MSLFSSIMDKIFHHPKAAPAPSAAPQQAVAAPAASTPAQAPAAEPAPTPQQPVDVEAVLSDMASKAPGGGGNWRTSIVDLLKLLDLDSSLQARKQLADELNVHAGEAGSAEENMALQKAVMAKLAQNGGKVPESLRS